MLQKKKMLVLREFKFHLSLNTHYFHLHKSIVPDFLMLHVAKQTYKTLNTKITATATQKSSNFQSSMLPDEGTHEVLLSGRTEEKDPVSLGVKVPTHRRGYLASELV